MRRYVFNGRVIEFDPKARRLQRELEESEREVERVEKQVTASLLRLGLSPGYAEALAAEVAFDILVPTDYPSFMPQITARTLVFAPHEPDDPNAPVHYELELMSEEGRRAATRAVDSGIAKVRQVGGESAVVVAPGKLPELLRLTLVELR